MVIVDLNYLQSTNQTVQGGRRSGIFATASGGASGNRFSTVSVFTGAYTISGRFKY